MKKTMNLKMIGLTLVLFAGNFNPYPTRAAEGGGSTGGGYAVGSTLLDFFVAEQRGMVAINVRQVAGFNEVVLPVLMKVAETVPYFHKELMDVLNNKTWYFVGTELSGSNDAMTQLKVDQVGKQSTLDIELYAPWFHSPATTTQNRGGLILHELLRGIAMNQGLLQIDLGPLTRLLMLDPSLNAHKIISRLSQLGFSGRYHYGAITEADEMKWLDGNEFSYSIKTSHPHVKWLGVWAKQACQVFEQRLKASGAATRYYSSSCTEPICITDRETSSCKSIFKVKERHDLPCHHSNCGFSPW